MKRIYNLTSVLLFTIVSLQAMQETASLTKIPEFKCQFLESLFINTSIEISLKEAQVIDALTKPKSNWESFWSIVSGNVNLPAIDNDASQELKEKTENEQPVKAMWNIWNAQSDKKNSYLHQCPPEIIETISLYCKPKEDACITLSGKAFRECSKVLCAKNQTKKSNACSTFAIKNKEYTLLTSKQRSKYPICCTFDKLAHLITQINKFEVLAQPNNISSKRLAMVIASKRDSDENLYEKQLYECGFKNPEIKILLKNTVARVPKKIFI